MMGELLIPPGPGKTAPRLITDLLDHDPRSPPRTGRNLLSDPAPQFRDTVLPPRRGPNDCHHNLCKKETQTHAPTSNDESPAIGTQYVVATYCSHCHYHVTVIVNFLARKGRKSPCSLSDEANPLHHLRLINSTNAGEHIEKYGNNKYNTLTEAHKFVCTGKECPTTVEIRISPPRMTKKLLGSILDASIVESRGRREIENDPDRYEGHKPVTPLLALGFLRQYLYDAKVAKDQIPTRRIARRNKKYMIAFADECNSIFEYLDFVAVEEAAQEPEEGTNYFWQLPTISETNINFIDECLIELDLLIQERPLSEHPPNGTRSVNTLLPALKDIERSLGYFDYPTRSRTVDLSREEHPFYASLGAVDNFTDEFLSWAYDRQCQVDPSNRPYYLDCLEDLAKGRGSPDLQTKVVMSTSVGEYGLKMIEKAYRFFGLDPDITEGDDYIIGVYKSRIESAPRQKDEAKKCLRIIAKHRDSEKIEQFANDNTMSFEEALEFLSVSEDTASDSIEAVAIAMSLDADKSKVALALRVIANKRGSDYVLLHAADSIAGTSSLNIAEAYSRLQIGTRNAPDETVLAYYQSLCSGAASGSKDSFTEALRVIAMDRKSNFLLRKLEDPNADIQASTAEPVGLDNIGNTCYLNSLLQYYYTIRPVRDMVIDFQNHRMDLNKDDINKKKVGGRSVDKHEIIKAQNFVDELHNLFENLKTASTRSVKPTRELAELTIFSTATVKDFNIHRSSISSPYGPPNISSILDGPVFGPQLPPPPSVEQTLSASKEDDIEMIDRPGDKTLQNGDDSSEATLVDLETLPSYNDVVGDSAGNQFSGDEKSFQVGDDVVESTDIGGDAVMVNGESGSDSNNTLVPEKPPPIPPRNKSGLSIQTTESKDRVPDDDLWRFGTQQDVTEVIGNVIFRLQCAIKPTSIEEGSGTQIDIIRETFYGANTTYTQKAQRLESKTEAWPSIIVFPGKVSRDIYEALDVVFDEQTVEIDNTTVPQYASMSKVPPILQIHIQRTDFDQELGRPFKNRNPVIFPEYIYLDRYIDSGDQKSALMQRRRNTWGWKAGLRALEARQAVLQNAEGNLSVPEALRTTKDYLSAIQEAEIDGVLIDSDLPDLLDDRYAEVTAELETIDLQITTLKQKIQDQFTDMRQYEYRLQSVFIHRGEAGGGHYWIYIYDFEHDIWREYNDEHVSEVKDRRRIFEQQGGAGGTPYYVVYVKSSEISLVNAVCREVPGVPVEDDVGTAWESGVVNEDEEMSEMSETRHVEHAKPRPLRPKPAVASDWDQTWSEKDASGIDAKGSPW